MPFAFAKSLFSSKSLKRHGNDAKDPPQPRPKRKSLAAKKQSVMQETALMFDPFAPPPPPLSPSLLNSMPQQPQPGSTEEPSPAIIIEQDYDDTANDLNRARTLLLPSRGPGKPSSSPNLRPGNHGFSSPAPLLPLPPLPKSINNPLTVPNGGETSMTRSRTVSTTTPKTRPILLSPPPRPTKSLSPKPRPRADSIKKTAAVPPPPRSLPPHPPKFTDSLLLAVPNGSQQKSVARSRSTGNISNTNNRPFRPLPPPSPTKPLSPPNQRSDSSNQPSASRSLPSLNPTKSSSNSSNGTPIMARPLTNNSSASISNSGRLRPLPLPPTPPPPITPPPPPSPSPSHASSGRQSGTARPLPPVPGRPARPSGWT